MLMIFSLLGCAAPQLKPQTFTCKKRTCQEGEKPEPIIRVAPRYPEIPLSYRQAGWVRMKVTIGWDGVVNHVEVIESEPGSVFDEYAMEAAMHWRYCPVMEGYCETDQVVTIKMVFDLEYQ